MVRHLLSASSVETSSPLLDTRIKRSTFVSSRRTIRVHGVHHAPFATVASRLEAIWSSTHRWAMGLNKLNQYTHSRPVPGANNYTVVGVIVVKALAS
jgi:hypothetical protein